MTPRPTGKVVPTSEGRDLVLVRTFPASIDDVWASITEPERTARWIASWSGNAAPGSTIRYRLVLEDGEPEGDMTIDACDPPRLLAVSTTDESGTWRLEARLEEGDGMTVLTLVHHLEDGIDIGSVGPGWEFYLDALTASRDELPLPNFDDYYPAQKPYYDELM